MLGAVVAMLAVVAIADYLFQYRQWYERQKMSLREMKEEFRQTEGDPHIKGKIRQLRHARMKKRMMAAVPKASVVITNPTHYAVALHYERGMKAPVCVAKGVDLIALKIREVAEAARHPDRRERAAGAGAARHRGDRPGDPAGALPRGRRDHRLRHAAASAGCPAGRGAEEWQRIRRGNCPREQRNSAAVMRLALAGANSGTQGLGARRCAHIHVDRLRPPA